MDYISDIYNRLFREDNTVYFTGDTSADSWAGVIDDEYDMTDDQVNDYIKSTKPELFDRLHGMKFSSSDIPLSFKPLRDLRRLDDMNPKRYDRNPDNQRYTTSFDKSVPLRKPSSSASWIYGHTLYPLQASRNNGQYRPFRDNGQEQTQDQLKLDGIAQGTILSAAERLYPKLEPAKTVPRSLRDNTTKPDHAFNHPPNSKQALDLRALKQVEINETLAEVAKYEKALKAAKSQLHRLRIRSPSPDASVLITRPFYMEPKGDRYKKQGLSKWDREKCNKELRRSGLFSDSTPVKDASKNMLFCYCREPDDGREMVRCSKRWCPVGWFHLQCTGLERLPFLNEEFHCCYCSDGLGPLVSEDLLDKRHRHPEIAARLVDSVEQQYLDHEVETEIIHEECEAGQSDTNAPGRPSIYDEDDEGDNEATENDEMWAAEEHARLHDKIVKWRAVNGPYQRSDIYADVLTPLGHRKSTTSSTISFFDDDSEDSQNEEEEGSLVSDRSTLRASSPTIAISESATSLDSNKENYNEEDYEQTGGYGADDEEVIDSEMTAVDSTEDSDDEYGSGQIESTYHNNPIKVRNLTSTTKSPATTEVIFPPQPTTITDSSRPHAINNKQSKSSLFTAQNSLPTHFPCFNNPTNYHSITGPRTPDIAPRVSPSRSKKPWGTPVNIKDFRYDFGYEFEPVAEPVSPSPDKKRKFEAIDDGLGADGRDRRGGLDLDLDRGNNESDVNEQDDEYNAEQELNEDSGERKEEMVAFMLDPQTP